MSSSHSLLPSSVLCPTASAVKYLVTTRWEERVPGKLTRTIIERRVTLQSRADGQHLRVSLQTTSPRLRKRDPLPQEQLVLQLAALYQHLELRVTRQGQVLALLNQPEIARTWLALEAELRALYGPDSQMLNAILPGVSQQVGAAARLVDSLRYDYFYALLFAGTNAEAGRAYPQFLDDTCLWFHKAPAPDLFSVPGSADREAMGIIDEARTDRVAVARQIDAALSRHGLGAEPATEPAALLLSSRRYCRPDAATGWPLELTATVACASPARGYAKEYDLTIEHA